MTSLPFCPYGGHQPIQRERTDLTTRSVLRHSPSPAGTRGASAKARALTRESVAIGVGFIRIIAPMDYFVVVVDLGGTAFTTLNLLIPARTKAVLIVSTLPGVFEVMIPRPPICSKVKNRQSATKVGMSEGFDAALLHQVCHQSSDLRCRHVLGGAAGFQLQLLGQEPLNLGSLTCSGDQVFAVEALDDGTGDLGSG